MITSVASSTHAASSRPFAFDKFRHPQIYLLYCLTSPILVLPTIEKPLPARAERGCTRAPAVSPEALPKSRWHEHVHDADYQRRNEGSTHGYENPVTLRLATYITRADTRNPTIPLA